MLSDVVAEINKMVPVLDVDKVRNRLSVVFTKYEIARLEEDTTEPNIKEKTDIFIDAKRLEGLSELTLDGYKLELNLLSKHLQKKVADVTPSDVRSYLATFPDSKMSTIGKKLSILKSFFGWLAGEEIIYRDPTARIKTPKTKKGQPKALTIEELEMLREGCETRRERAMMEVLYATGARLSEVHQLNRSDVDESQMSSQVLGKGSKEREVYLSYRAMYHLKKYLETRDDDADALFATLRRPFRRLGRRGIQREIKKIAGRVGLAYKVSPHVLRHTFATLTLNNGAELVAVQELLGHSSPDTTLRYARISEERKREQHRRYLVQ